LTREVLERLAAALLDPGIPPALVYTAVFFSCILESFFPPWPTDVISIYAGFLAGRGYLAPSLVLLAAVLGTQIGVMAVFWMSRRWGRALLEGPLGRYVPRTRLVQLELWFARYGAPAISISRFFPGVRALVMPAAGLAGFSAWKVWVYAGLSVVLWNMFVVGIGLLAGTHLDRAKHFLVQYNTLAGAIVGVAVAAVVLRTLYRRRRRPPLSPPPPTRGP
jgi:membrane protein DedA with SNARE-associated domain